MRFFMPDALIFVNPWSFKGIINPSVLTSSSVCYAYVLYIFLHTYIWGFGKLTKYLNRECSMRHQADAVHRPALNSRGLLPSSTTQRVMRNLAVLGKAVPSAVRWHWSSLWVTALSHQKYQPCPALTNKSC